MGQVIKTYEVLTAAGLSILLLIGFMSVVPIEAAVTTAVLAFAMALITTADLRRFVVPDLVSLPMIPAGLISNILVFHGGDWRAGLIQSAVGAVAGGSAFFLVRLVYRWARGVEGLGLGDVKLAAVAGAWLGVEPLAEACLLAALSALAVVAWLALRKGVEHVNAGTLIPFGAFMAPVILLFWILRVLSGFLLL